MIRAASVIRAGSTRIATRLDLYPRLLVSKIALIWRTIRPALSARIRAIDLVFREAERLSELLEGPRHEWEIGLDAVEQLPVQIVHSCHLCPPGAIAAGRRIVTSIPPCSRRRVLKDPDTTDRVFLADRLSDGLAIIPDDDRTPPPGTPDGYRDLPADRGRRDRPLDRLRPRLPGLAALSRPVSCRRRTSRPWIEFSHRFSGAIVSALMLAMVAAAWVWARHVRHIVVPATAVPIMLAVQIGLGAWVVWLETPALTVMVHLSFAFVILAFVLWVNIAARVAANGGSALAVDGPVQAPVVEPSRLDGLLAARAGHDRGHLSAAGRRRADARDRGRLGL